MSNFRNSRKFANLGPFPFIAQELLQAECSPDDALSEARATAVIEQINLRRGMSALELETDIQQVQQDAVSLAAIARVEGDRLGVHDVLHMTFFNDANQARTFLGVVRRAGYDNAVAKDYPSHGATCIAMSEPLELVLTTVSRRTVPIRRMAAMVGGYYVGWGIGLTASSDSRKKAAN